MFCCKMFELAVNQKIVQVDETGYFTIMSDGDKEYHPACPFCSQEIQCNRKVDVGASF